MRVDFNGAFQLGLGEVVTPHLHVFGTQFDVILIRLFVVGFLFDAGGQVIAIVAFAAKAEAAAAAQHDSGSQGAESCDGLCFHRVSTSFLESLRSRRLRSLTCPTSCPQAASMSSPRVLRMVAT